MEDFEILGSRNFNAAATAIKNDENDVCTLHVGVFLASGRWHISVNESLRVIHHMSICNF
jgi:hypothetical protein